MGIRWTWFRIGAVGVGALVLGLAVRTAGEIYNYQDTLDEVKLPAVDTIVCLAGGRGRIAAAGDLWLRYRDRKMKPTLFLSGLGPQATWNTVRASLRAGIRGVIRPDDVVIEHESGNTVENAQLYLRHARGKGWRRVLLMTSRYHMRRAKLIFESVFREAGVPIEVETLSVIQDPFEPGEWITSFQGVRVTVEEYLKWLYYRWVWRPRAG